MNDLNKDMDRLLYPRVSEIIAKQNMNEFRGIDLQTLANACIRGTKVHSYCTTLMKGLFCPDIEEEYAPYVDAFMEWADENIEETLHSAERLYDDELKYTGEFDMIVKLKEGEIALIDIKTSSAPSKTWPLQIAAYRNLCNLNGYKVDTMMNVHLKKTKAALYEEKEGKKVLVSPPEVKVSVRPYTQEQINASWGIFASALKCYDYFDRKEAN